MRILIADCFTDFTDMLQNAFAEEADFVVVGYAENGLEALEMVKTLMPDILLADMVLPRLDGLRLLQKIEQSDLVFKPKTIFVSSIVYPAMFEEARSLHAEHCMLKPVDLEALIDRIRLLGGMSCGLAPLEPEREEKGVAGVLSGILRDIGAPVHVQGYHFMREAILLTAQNPEAARSITKMIYPSVAKTFATTQACVERSIGYAIQLTWDKAERGTLERYFGIAAQSERRPTNSRFIAVLAEIIRVY